MTAEIQFQPGERITHYEYGQGVVLDPARDGYLRAFFGVGERRVPVASLRREVTRTERILRAVDGGAERSRKAWLSYEAHALPVMESASALTSAKIDLLPHQVVLTHRIATASPRRYLIADEVGLGKTIEAALILRELASRGVDPRADGGACGPCEQLAPGIERGVQPRLRGIWLRGRHHRPQNQCLRQARPADRQHRHFEASSAHQALAGCAALGSSGV